MSANINRSARPRMRRLAIASALVSSLALAANAQVDPKVAAQCKDARDFAGCVKAFTTPAAAPDDGLSSLRNAMKQVAGRLSAGTSLRDSTATFQPVTDALAIAEGTHGNSFTVKQARFSANLFSIMQAAWDAQIKAKAYQLSQYMKGEDIYECSILKRVADAFDSAYGSTVIGWSYKKGLFGISACRVPYGQLPVDYMYPVVVRVLREGAISPEEQAAKDAAARERAAMVKRERELAALEPWNRYLEENPDIKKWAEANPKAAEAEKKKFIEKQNRGNSRELQSSTYTKDCSQQPSKELFSKCMQGL
jgi:hypothetical protein